MATFMEKSSIEARNGHSFGDETLQSHFSKDTFPHLQFLGPETRDYLTKRDRLANQCNVYSARTVIDNFIQERR